MYHYAKGRGLLIAKLAFAPSRRAETALPSGARGSCFRNGGVINTLRVVGTNFLIKMMSHIFEDDTLRERGERKKSDKNRHLPPFPTGFSSSSFSLLPLVARHPCRALGQRYERRVRTLSLSPLCLFFCDCKLLVYLAPRLYCNAWHRLL